MEYPKLFKKAASQVLYYFYKFSGIAQQKVLVKSIKSEVRFNDKVLPQREFYALSKRGKEMAWGKVVLGRFLEYKYHYCIFNGTVVHPLYRRRNLASKLVKARVDFCRKENFEYLLVPVESTNMASIKTMVNCGFSFPPKSEWTKWMKAELELMQGNDLMVGVIDLKQ
ncbi:GNAT family N-acetyltransferase [Carboxylicivirga sp. A043]|uniref:GNAT family N-acetyltransferase n=1 Tax=Carboxylicivirga litoralis TaxID=2816963 RepID=UPI0021CB14D4|nr:GNAT family N-acetyltransferase [Carboxylicivirga sp. A043]MCU4157552.1 GNAT family N-acetyltransferase [Carboxylicivirga sp. A043]